MEINLIYENISMFENKTHIQNVADRVKNLSYVEISYEESINDSSVFFVINRVLTSIEKDFSLAKINSTCKENTLFISLNQTKEGCLNLNLENNIKENLQTFEYFLVI